MRIKTKKVIEVQDWNKLVEETYGRPYDFQQQDGCKGRGVFEFSVPNEETCDFENDFVPEVVNGDEMGVSFAAWLARDPKQKLNTEDEWDREYGLDLWWTRNFYPDVSMIINDLHKKGLLEVGEYIINIDW